MKCTKTKWNQLTTSGAYRVINLSLYNHIRDLHATLMIEELIDMYYYQHGNKKLIDDYIYYTDKSMGDKILVSANKVGDLRNILLNHNYVSYIRKGNPCKGHYKINFDQIERDIKTNLSLSKTKNEDQNKSEAVQ